jgi:hypothetical protein
MTDPLHPDIQISFKWGGKDGKWRWMTEVGAWATAGEERFLQDAMSSAHFAVQKRLQEIPQ